MNLLLWEVEFKKKKVKSRKKIAIEIKEKDKIIIAGGKTMRVLKVAHRDIDVAGKTQAFIAFEGLIGKDKKERLLVPWNEMIKIPEREDPTHKMPWLSGRLSKWLKSMEIKQEW